MCGLFASIGGLKVRSHIRDILPGFFRFAKTPLQRHFTTFDHLFPKALMQPGMRHSIDRMIRRTLTSLEFFPDFLGGLKSINCFVREHRRDILLSLRRAKYGAVADLLAMSKNPPFAKWRWGNSELLGWTIIGTKLGENQFPIVYHLDSTICW